MLHGRALHHIALLVQDLARAEAFYAGLLGMQVAQRWHEKDGTLRSVWLSFGNDGLLMLERGTEARAERGGWHLLALRIAASERAQVEAGLLAKGVPITGRTDYTLYFHDPEGNRWGLSHWPDAAA